MVSSPLSRTPTLIGLFVFARRHEPEASECRARQTRRCLAERSASSSSSSLLYFRCDVTSDGDDVIGSCAAAGRVTSSTSLFDRSRPLDGTSSQQ